MAMKTNKTIEDQIPHGKYLNFVHKMKAAFMPVEDREQYLRDAANQKKIEADEEERLRKRK